MRQISKWVIDNLATVADVVALVVCFGFFFLTVSSAVTFTDERLGTGGFGDAFGVVNAAFTGFTLHFLGVSIYLQRSEVKLVKEERDDTKALLAAQQDLLDDQTEALAAQVFEASFSAQLATITSIVETLSDATAGEPVFDRAAKYIRFGVIGLGIPKPDEINEDLVLNLVQHVFIEVERSPVLQKCMPLFRMRGFAC